MRESYLRRLSRPYRSTAADRPIGAEQSTTAGQWTATDRSTMVAGPVSAGERRALIVVAPAPDRDWRDSAGQGLEDRGVALASRHDGPEQSAAPRRRRRPVEACEVCGRTLLTGERAREIVFGEQVVQACALCVIGAQRAVRQEAA